MEAAGVSYSGEEDYDWLATASSVLDQMPPGFRFHPTDKEIILHYLLHKVINRWFRAVAVAEIDLNKCEPWDLPQKSNIGGEKEWYFFFEKETKYPSGTRTNRATPSGYWKGTGKDKEIYDRDKKRLVGMMKTLVFYKGRAPKGEKTNWVIHEYRLHGDYSAYNLSHDAKEKWVVCKVFHKKNEERTSSGVELARIDSFVNRCLLESPTLLTDYSSCTEKPSSSYAADQFKATTFLSTLMSNDNMLQGHNDLLFPNSCNQHSVAQMVHLPYQDGRQNPNSRPDIYIGGNEPDRMCKMEDTGLSSEIDKIRHDEVVDEGLSFSANTSDLGSLWSY